MTEIAGRFLEAHFDRRELLTVPIVRAMSAIDEVLAANEIYSHNHELHKLTPHPERKLAVLTCMDTRLSIRTLG